MIYVFSEGGSGSVYFSQKVNVGVRPDVVWGFNPPLKENPKIPSDAFEKRGGIPLDLGITIEENLVNMLRARENEGVATMLSGRCSQVGHFLTDNEIKATCFVRHPLHSFISFLGFRHPEHAKQFGGINNMDAILFYAGLWNAMVDDFIRSGNVVYRFEYMPDEIIDDWLCDRLKGWNNELRHYNGIHKELEEELEELVSKNFYQLYDDWEI